MQTAVTTAIRGGADLLSINSESFYSYRLRPFYELSPQRNRTHATLRFYMTFCMTPLSCVLHPSHCFIWRHSKSAGSDLTPNLNMTSSLSSSAWVEWSKLPLPKIIMCKGKIKDGKWNRSQLWLHGTRPVTQGFLTPTWEVMSARKLLNDLTWSVTGLSEGFCF